MVASSGNVITTLRDRWSIEREIQAMLGIRSEQAFSDRARQVATSGEQVLPVLLGQLDQADARTVGVLGIVASHYPDRQQIIEKLNQAATDLERPDRGRVSAILILERFLEQETDPYLLSTLDDPRFMATESIREMIREGENDPRAWIEYTRSLIEQPPETIWDIMETLLDVGGARAVPALCLLAQEVVDGVSEAALHTLGRVNHPSAARGLRSIVPLLSPDRRVLARRSLLKLQLKQIASNEPTADPGFWRTLVGPPDGHGYQVVWFIHTPDPLGRSKFLGLSIHESVGIQHAYGHHNISPEMVPGQRPLGELHSVVVPGSSDTARLLMLETCFGYRRGLAQQAQERMIAAGQWFPIEYRLMGPWVWEDEQSEHDFVAISVPAAAPSESLASGASLLRHPALRGWFADGERLLGPVTALLLRMPAGRARAQGHQGLTPTNVSGLARQYFDPASVERLRNRLQAMSEWLARAGQIEPAALASAIARDLGTTAPDQHPFTLAMVKMGARILVEQLTSN